MYRRKLLIIISSSSAKCDYKAWRSCEHPRNCLLINLQRIKTLVTASKGKYVKYIAFPLNFEQYEETVWINSLQMPAAQQRTLKFQQAGGWMAIVTVWQSHLFWCDFVRDRTKALYFLASWVQRIEDASSLRSKCIKDSAN